ncbi:type II toxin-antitoxin system HipA family toxin [Ruania suaedae]|uniref:type II toxin-antitoxin system HipA family toxin n=1 Tax=Ruania suaedae TaxID=2897774 RepID=UPI001E522DE5|nr:type II toxin-antitoxin system HipA family toxin [Ruania suaedae]UFU02232.1 type II toxin-antitoxin system HipA family toxin [Ruania suaedae]
MRAPSREFAVHVELGVGTVHAGTAYVTQGRGTVTTAFTYSTGYLRTPGAYALGPDLPLDQRSHAISGLPGALSDTAPDRWGRTLIAKRLRALDRGAERTTRTVSEVDYLLGVSDYTRQGALRYSSNGDAPFLADDHEVPPLIELPALMHAADAISRDDDDHAAVKALLRAGTGSLGGARPKASVRDGDQLLIAKFSHPNDDWDVMAWEKTALDLAETAGIEVPARRLVTIDARHALLLTRFDRAQRRRIPYISAMTLLGADDGEPRDYLEIAEALAEHSSAPSADLRQLWRRAVFSCAVNNTDDHLRNLGFLRSGAGWALSPAFDINPNPDPAAGHATTAGWAPAQSAATYDSLMQNRAEFGLDTRQAEAIANQVIAATANWTEVATRNEVPERQLERFRRSFARLA